MFSVTAEYALRAVTWIAAQPDKPATNHDLAAATQVPSGYLAKVLQSLARAQLVTGQRGPNGGFTLARPAAQIRVLDVVNAVDPIRRITNCPLKLPAHRHRLCAMHQRLDDAIAALETILAENTIADLVADDAAFTLAHAQQLAESKASKAAKAKTPAAAKTAARAKTPSPAKSPAAGTGARARR